MKTLLAILFLPLVLLAQMPQQMMLNSPPSSAAWTPAQLSLKAWFCAHDIPKDSNVYNWTNKMPGGSAIVMTNNGQHTTNSSNGRGVFFAGSNTEVFTNKNSGVPWTNGFNTTHFNSIWVRLTITNLVTGFNVIVANSYIIGGALATYSSVASSLRLQNGADSGTGLIKITTNTQVDIFINGTNSATVSAIVYTNGVLCGNCTAVAQASGTLWGFGRDADSDGYFTGWLQDVAIGNDQYVFSAADMANIATYPY